VAHVIIVSCSTCDMYKSSLRHIHDPVLSSLKMKGILSFIIFLLIYILAEESLQSVPLSRLQFGRHNKFTDE
jgi:hypothetical protein